MRYCVAALVATAEKLTGNCKLVAALHRARKSQRIGLSPARFRRVCPAPAAAPAPVKSAIGEHNLRAAQTRTFGSGRGDRGRFVTSITHRGRPTTARRIYIRGWPRCSKPLATSVAPSMCSNRCATSNPPIQTSRHASRDCASEARRKAKRPPEAGHALRTRDRRCSVLRRRRLVPSPPHPGH